MKKNTLLKVISTTFLMTSCQSITSNSDLGGLNSNLSRHPTQIKQLQLFKSKFIKGEVKESCNRSIEKFRSGVNEIINDKKYDNPKSGALLDYEILLSDLDNEVLFPWMTAYFYPNADVRSEGSDCNAAQASVLAEFDSNKNLYFKLKNQTVSSRREKKLKALLLERFEKLGVQLDQSIIDKNKTILEQIAQKEAQYQQIVGKISGTIFMSKEELVGLGDDDLNQLIKLNDGRYEINLVTSYKDLLKKLSSSESRKKILSSYNDLIPDSNFALLEEIFSLKAQLAKNLGFKTYFDYSLNYKMLKNTKNLNQMYQSLEAKLKEKQSQQMSELLKFAQKINPGLDKLNDWDIAYYRKKYSAEKFDIDSDKFKEYFPSEITVYNIFKIYEKIFGIKIQHQEYSEVWDPDVKLFAISDAKTSTNLGYFFLDIYRREGKTPGAFEAPLKRKNYLSKVDETMPLAMLILNIPKSNSDRPALLSQKEVGSIFHEFGHALHDIFSKAPYRIYSGMANVRSDFAEIPSMALEQLAYDHNILKLISGHYKNKNEKIPEDYLNKLDRFNRFTAIFDNLTYQVRGNFDLKMHTLSSDYNSQSTYNMLFEKYMQYKPIEKFKGVASTIHITLYGANFYSYLLGDIVGKDLYQEWKKNNFLNNSNIMKNYSKTILEPGAMEEPSEIIQKFLGRPFNSNAFLESLKD